MKMDNEQKVPTDEHIKNSEYYKKALDRTDKKPYMIGLYQLCGGYYRNWYRITKRRFGTPEGFSEKLFNELISVFFNLGIQRNYLSQYPKAYDLYNQCKQKKGKHCSLLR